MVYIDPPQENIWRDVGPRFKKGQMFAHLSADTEKELRAFAKKVGMPMWWIQHSGTPAVHFDVTGGWLDRLRAHPDVRAVSHVMFIAKLRAKREVFKRRKP
jgi:hypothetical protein